MEKQKIDKEIIHDVYLAELFINRWDKLTEDERVHVCEKANYSVIPERYILDNDRIDYVDFSRIEKMLAIRLLIRNRDLLDYIDIRKFSYTIKEIYYLIRMDINLLLTDLFNIDFNNLPQSDALILLTFGNHEIKKLLDLSKYNFGFIDCILILRSFEYTRKLIIEIGASEKLKGYQVAEVLENTGEENIDLFNLDRLSPIDWVNVLRTQPTLFKYVDLQKFYAADPFYIAELAIMFDKYELLDNINKNDLSPLGWEKLLVANPDKFCNECDFNKLDDVNWNEILKTQPQLSEFRK